MKKKIAFGSLLMFGVMFLSSCDTTNVGIDTSTFLEKLIPNIYDFLAQLVAFIIMLVAVFYLAYKPIKKIINKRKDYVRRNVKEAEDELLKAESKNKEASQNITSSKKTAQDIIEKAKIDASKETNSIISKAKQDAQEEVEKGRLIIAQETKKAQEDIHNSIVNVALDVSERILNREVNKEDNDRLVDDFIDKMNKEKTK